MDRIKHRSYNRLTDKNNFPFLKQSLVMSKALMAVSRVDLDSRIITRQSKLIKASSKQLDHTRTYSGINKKNNEQKKNKSISRNLAQMSYPVNQKYNRFKSNPVTNQLYQTQKEYNKQLETTRAINIQKSRISSKPYGLIKSYAANSHPGLLNSLNQDRVCIVTNLNKTSNKANQVSFFAIYDGYNGSGLSDYMRDTFHNLLIQDQMFWKDIQISIKNALKKIQKNFHQNPIYAKDSSSVNFVILIIIGQICYYVQMGEPKAVISKNLGKERNIIVLKQNGRDILNSINIKYKGRSSSVKKLKSNQTTSKITISNMQNYNYNYVVQYKNKKQLSIKKVQLDKSIDFIILGSQGVFQAYKQNDLMKKTWTGILQSNIYNNYNNIHATTGQAVNHLMNDIINGYTTKNVSIILLTFNSVQELLQPDEKIILPHHQSNDKIEYGQNLQ